MIIFSRFWYLSLVACRRNASCGWQHVSQPFSIDYDLNIVNGRPDKNNNPFEYHFSFEKQVSFLIFTNYFGN